MSKRADGPILIGYAESLAAIECAWILLDHGFEVVVFSCDAAKAPLARSRELVVRTVRSPLDDAAAAVADVAALATEIGAIAVLPLDDDALWVCAEGVRTGEITVPVAGPTGARAALALDKAEQLEAAEKAGLPVPSTLVFRPGDEVRAQLPVSADGRWMVKPAGALSVVDGKLRHATGVVAHSPGEVIELLRSAETPLLVQPRLSGVGEGLFGVADDNGVLAWTSHKRIRMMNPLGSGSSACLSIDPDPTLLPAAEKFLADAEWRGLFMLEFLRDTDGQPWLMELNGRAWGSMALARRRGFAYPAWAVQAVIDPGFSQPAVVPGPHVAARNLGREILHVAFVIRGRRTRDGDWPRVWPTVRAVVRWHRGDTWYNARRGEARVFLADAWTTVASRVPRR